MTNHHILFIHKRGIIIQNDEKSTRLAESYTISTFRINCTECGNRWVCKFARPIQTHRVQNRRLVIQQRDNIS